jgi:hypothetical protein
LIKYVNTDLCSKNGIITGHDTITNSTWRDLQTNFVPPSKLWASGVYPCTVTCCWHCSYWAYEVKGNRNHKLPQACDLNDCGRQIISCYVVCINVRHVLYRSASLAAYLLGGMNTRQST